MYRRALGDISNRQQGSIKHSNNVQNENIKLSKTSLTSNINKTEILQNSKINNNIHSLANNIVFFFFFFFFKQIDIEYPSGGLSNNEDFTNYSFLFDENKQSNFNDSNDEITINNFQFEDMKISKMGIYYLFIISYIYILNF